MVAYIFGRRANGLLGQKTQFWFINFDPIFSMLQPSWSIFLEYKVTFFFRKLFSIGISVYHLTLFDVANI